MQFEEFKKKEIYWTEYYEKKSEQTREFELRLKEIQARLEQTIQINQKLTITGNAQ
jgi:hypothetical protein